MNEKHHKESCSCVLSLCSPWGRCTKFGIKRGGVKTVFTVHCPHWVAVSLMRAPWILVSIPHQLEDFFRLLPNQVPFSDFPYSSLSLPHVFSMLRLVLLRPSCQVASDSVLLGGITNRKPKVEKKEAELLLPPYLRCWSFLTSCSSYSLWALTALSSSQSLISSFCS